MNRIKPHFNSLGVTLVELVISIVVIGVAVAGVLAVMTRNTQSSADPMVQHQATAIAEAYLEEILLKPFNEDAASGIPEGPLGPDAGEPNRTLFDDVNDYNGLNDIGARDQNNNPIVGLEAYTVNITVGFDTLNTILQPSNNALRVTVAVTTPKNEIIVVSGYRTNY